MSIRALCFAIVITATFAASFLGSTRSESFALEEESLPLQLPPQQLANQLVEPVRTFRLVAAETIAETQKCALRQAECCPESAFEIALFGLSLAAEEYNLMELTYPDSVSNLLESGYLLDGWLEMGFTFVDYDEYSYPSTELQIVYVPQPIGLVDLICVPNRHCSIKMRNYAEYSLAVDTDCIDILFSEPPGIRTWWFLPFYQNGLVEVLHISRNNPVTSSCATCTSN